MPTELSSGCKVRLPTPRQIASEQLAAAIRKLRGRDLEIVHAAFGRHGGQHAVALMDAAMLQRVEQALAELPADDPARPILEQLHGFYRGEDAE